MVIVGALELNGGGSGDNTQAAVVEPEHEAAKGVVPMGGRGAMEGKGDGDQQAGRQGGCGGILPEHCASVPEGPSVDDGDDEEEQANVMRVVKELVVGATSPKRKPNHDGEQ